MKLDERLDEIKREARASLDEVKNQADLDTWQIRFLGRKGLLAEAMKELPTLPLAEKKRLGPLANDTKKILESLILKRQKDLIQGSNNDSQGYLLDVTIPITQPLGHLHPITIIERRVVEIFSTLGFSLFSGPELEEARLNFDALNFPKDHPARDMQDTFWIKDSKGKTDEYVMRTHTSPGQVRFMKKHTPPFRAIIPGKVYRNDATDATHENTFHQFECLMVDEAPNVSIATFKYLAELFFHEFFETKVTVRLRPSFFPFTEPSFEFDISCMICHGKDTHCSTCKGGGWIEIGGAGMVHQNVFEAAGYPRGKYQGFAWGFGLTRLALMKYGITDIRLLLSGDTRFISQF